MRSMPVSEFKTKCLAVLKELNETNETLLVTRHGRPYAEVRGHTDDLDDVLARFRGSVKVRDNIVAPTKARWKAQR